MWITLKILKQYTHLSIFLNIHIFLSFLKIDSSQCLIYYGCCLIDYTMKIQFIIDYKAKIAQ